LLGVPGVKPGGLQAPSSSSPLFAFALPPPLPIPGLSTHGFFGNQRFSLGISQSVLARTNKYLCDPKVTSVAGGSWVRKLALLVD